MTIITDNTSLASLILRLGMGGMMIPHGWGKFQRLIAGETSFANPLGIGEFPSLLLAVFAELICPVLLLLGYKSKLASIPPAITMLVAAFIIHAGDPWGKKEFPLLYLVGFTTVFLLGSGKYSLDWKSKKV